MADAEAPAEGEPAWKAATAKPSVLPRSPVTWAIIVLAVGLVGFGYAWWSQQPERELGDHGEVVAGVDRECMVLAINVDGLAFQGSPAGGFDWRTEEQVPGTLEVTKVTGWSQMEGIFTSDDGSKVVVYGGKAGQTLFRLGCAVWADPFDGGP